MATNKIQLMQKLYGRHPGAKCETCSHLGRYHYHDKHYYKCDVYGVTNSEASDWRCKNEACGLYNTETTDREIIRLVRPERRAEILNEPIQGQIELFER